MSSQNEAEEVVKEQLKEAYLYGVKDGITMFAHWKDGVQYVGSCGLTLKKALEEVDKGGAV